MRAERDWMDSCARVCIHPQLGHVYTLHEPVIVTLFHPSCHPVLFLRNFSSPLLAVQIGSLLHPTLVKDTVTMCGSVLVLAAWFLC